MNTIIECDTMEYAVISEKRIEMTTFHVNEKSVVISFCKKEGKVIMQSEISIEDAKQLAKLISCLT